MKHATLASTFPLMAVIAFTAWASPPKFVRLSYSQSDATKTIGIAWNSDSANDPTTVEYGKDASYGQTAQGTAFAGPGALKAIHEVTITELTPDTIYHYRVGGPGAWSQDYTFRTAPASGCVPITFVAAGDDRSDDDSGASPRWGPILMEALEAKPLFFLNTGDLVKDGDKDKQWRDFLEKSEPSLAFTAHMPTIGNHDDGPGQGDSAYYNQVFHLPKNPSSQTEDYYFFTAGDVIVVSLSTQTFEGGGGKFADQAAYLDKVLTENPRTWKFVFFHHPTYCSHLSFLGWDISHPANENGQNAAFTPIIDKHHVDMVFYGHNHWYERFEPMKGKGGDDEGQPVGTPDKGTYYVVTGGAGALTYGVLDVIKLFCPNTKGSKVCDGDYHYVKIEIDNNKLTFTAQATKTQLLGSSDGNFKVLDSFSYEKPFPDGKDPCLVVNPEPDPVPEPIPEPAVEPVPEPGPDPVHEPAPEPVPEPVPEPAPDVPDPGSPAEDPGAPPVDPGQPDVQPQPEVAVADGEADAGAVETSIATAGKSGGCGGCSAAAGNGFGWLVALLVAFARLAVRFIFRRRDSVPGNSETSR